MADSNPLTPSGYSDVPPGHIAAVVTCLQMLERPAMRDAPLPEGVTISPMEKPDTDAYRALFRKIGADWLWYSRILMAEEELSAILNHPDVVIHVVREAGEDIGLVELDFRDPGQCELVFFGLVSNATGKGFGRAVMNHALALAWSRPIARLWVHTCTLDHPSALGFYIRSGFTPYAFQVETQADPRLTGHLPLTAAPHVPLIRPVTATASSPASSGETRRP